MASTLTFASRHFPARAADLGFRVELPTDWIAHDLPGEPTDFADPTAFLPLAVVMAPHAALVFAFGGRPAYEDGTLHDWAWFLLKHNELTPRAVAAGLVDDHPAALVEATKESELGTMIVRFALFEDGGRLVNLTFTAPEVLDGAVRDAWFVMLGSFRLETRRGSRFALEETAAAPATAEVAEAQAIEPAESTAPMQTTAPMRAQMPAIEPIGMPLPPDLPPRKCRFADFALAEDAASLDPESAINANLRDRGAGLVPNVIEISNEARRARVAAGAIEALIDVPLGWHVIDDGQRTLMLHPAGQVQVHLEIVPRDDRDDDVILDAIESGARDAYPAPRFERRTDGAFRTMSVRNIADGGDPIEQHHILRQHARVNWVVRARVTATPETSTDAWILGTLVLESLQFPTAVASDDETAAFAPKHSESDALGEPEASRAESPAWWIRALELEAQNQLEAAENTIRDGCQHMGFAASTAEMYRRRMNRLKDAGDSAGAREAFKRSSDFMTFYASMATSGGEGAALSYERDLFRAQLVAEFGSDPEARCA